MFKHLPGTVEILIFAVLATIAAALVARGGSPDAGLSLLSFPIFIFAAVMGLWKSGRLSTPDDAE